MTIAIAPLVILLLGIVLGALLWAFGLGGHGLKL
jgi:hypothetical protein